MFEKVSKESQYRFAPLDSSTKAGERSMTVCVQMFDMLASES